MSVDKEEVRRRCKTRLSRIAVRADRYGADKSVQCQLHRLVASRNTRRIMAYIPLRIEADIRPLLDQWRRKGIAVYVPFMEGESFGLVQYRYPLKRKRFGIREPKSKVVIKKRPIDIALIPTVAFDATYRRIGFGKGMYDRFFQKEGRRIGICVFVMRRACCTPKRVSDDYDVKADIIITGGR